VPKSRAPVTVWPLSSTAISSPSLAAPTPEPDREHPADDEAGDHANDHGAVNSLDQNR
jgi:hypothetical protein